MDVFLTVDTEGSVGGAYDDPRLGPVGPGRRVFGRVNGGEWGIGPMMTIAEESGLRLVFYVEAFMARAFGPQALEEVVAAVLSRGHDAQLHLHPNFLNFPPVSGTREDDYLGRHPLRRQAELLEEGLNLLEAAGAPRPRAFRAGSYAIGPESFQALALAGLEFDSSYNAAFQRHVGIMPDLGINDAVRLPQGIVELPVTVYRENSLVRSSRLKPLDINGSSFPELRAALLRGRDMGLATATIMLHSFSFMKAFDMQYARVRPRREVMGRFRALCRFLAGTPGFTVRTMAGLGNADVERMTAGNPTAVPEVPTVLSMAKLAGQAVAELR